MWAKRLFLIIPKFVPPRCGDQGPLCGVAPRESAEPLLGTPCYPNMKAFQDLDFRGGPKKSIIWAISLLAPRAEFGSVGRAEPTRINWGALRHVDIVASACRQSEMAYMAVFGRFAVSVAISREKRPKTVKLICGRTQTTSCSPGTRGTPGWSVGFAWIGALAPHQWRSLDAHFLDGWLGCQ
jgi:hypothetical protein